MAHTISAGPVSIHILADEESMGRAAADAAISAGQTALERGQDVSFWLMAAPSAFAFYRAFIDRAASDEKVAALAREADYFQLDDYPISRASDRFPVTFRHLLEERFFGPLQTAVGGVGPVHLLDLTGTEQSDDRVMGAYRDHLLSVLDDPGSVVVQVKGIGMDGHWAFHGAETPIDAPADIIRVPMGEANRHQQMIDWPEYFRRIEEIPEHAVTCTVELLLQADVIVDVVPQAEKEYAVLACYGDSTVSPAVPSSALKRHQTSASYLTEAAARALVELRALRENDCAARLAADTVSRLRTLWQDSKDPERTARNVGTMKAVLGDLGFV